MKSIAWALTALALVFAPSSAIGQPTAQLHDVQLGALAIEVHDTHASFEVIDSRMDETGTAAVFFGMIGAVVNSAANGGEDDAKAAPLRETAAAIDLDGIILQAIRERLVGHDNVQLADAAATAGNTLVVEIGDWGLIRRAQHPDTAMRVFIKLDVTVLDAHGRRVYGPEHDHSIGQLNAELPAFTPEVFRTEIVALATRSGRQIANTVIYR